MLNYRFKTLVSIPGLEELPYLYVIASVIQQRQYPMNIFMADPQEINFPLCPEKNGRLQALQILQLGTDITHKPV